MTNIVLHRLSLTRRIVSASLTVGAVCSVSFGTAVAQQYRVASALPDDPGAVLAQQASGSLSSADATGAAAITGMVLDPSGAAIANARVRLSSPDAHIVREIRSGPDGDYTVGQLPAGTYTIRIDSAGFVSYTSAPFSLSKAQFYTAAPATLAVAGASTDVQVNADNSKIADAQVKAAEKQRVLGVVPNFYTSFIYDAAPLTSREKYRFALRETFDPIRFVGTGIGAAIEQANNTYAGYGDGAAGYGKRYAALYGDGLFSDLLSHAVFPSIFHQDPRYFYQGTGTIKSRFIHAVSFAVLIRNDSGRNVPNYSYLLGDLVAGSIDNLYYPHADRGPGLVFTNTAIGIGGRAAGSLVREFILPRLTTHKAGAGKKPVP